MSVSRLHHCIGQIKVAEGSLEPPAPKCRCRKYISNIEADRMCEKGEASRIVIERKRETIEKPCQLCKGDPEFKNCPNCEGKGKETKVDESNRYGHDIVLVSHMPANEMEKKRSSALAKKTPRVATIESKHIVLAYVLGVKEAAERIEEYGSLIQTALQEQGAELREPKNFLKPTKIPKVIFPGKVEPEDNRERGQGRRYDYGRTI